MVLWATLGLGIALGASAQEREVHGESSEFAGHGITMAWGILRAPAEADTQVVLRVARAGADHVAVSVDGVSRSRLSASPSTSAARGRRSPTSRGAKSISTRRPTGPPGAPV
jgi:hypothetical protein